MACGDFPTYKQFWYEGQFLDAVYCPFADQLGPLLVGLLFFAAIGLALYISADGATVPITMSIVLASVIFVEVPSGAVQIGAIAIVLALGIVGYLMVQRIDTI